MAEAIAKVLVCDDETFFREAIRDVLTSEQLEVVEASDGEAALELARDLDVGVVVLDMRLPGIDGLGVLKQLSESRPELRVIMLSANSDQELVLEALRSGACDYLAKPLHDEELVLAVRRAAEGFAIADHWGRLRGRLALLADGAEEMARRADECDADERDGVLANAAAQVASDVLEVARASLLLVDEEAGVYRVGSLHGRNVDVSSLAPVPLSEGIAGIVFERGEPVAVADVTEDASFSLYARAERYDTDAFAIAPVAIADRRLGLLCVTDRAGGGAFSQEDLCLLRLLAGQVASLQAGGLGRRSSSAESEGAEPDEARGAAEERTGDRDAELARAICDAITAEVEPERIFEGALRPIEQELDAAPVSLYLIDAKEGVLRCEASCDGAVREDRETLPLDRGLAGAVLQTGRMVATDEPDADVRFDPEVDTPLDGTVLPLLCAPLSLRGKVVGIFRAYPRGGAADCVRSGEVLSAALSAAVRNALLYRSLLESIDEVASVRRTARR